MRESRPYGSVRGALSNERPYRDFRFPWLGFSFLKAWIFLPQDSARMVSATGPAGDSSPLRAEGELSGPTELDEQ